PTAAPSAAPGRAAGALAGLRRRGRGAGIDAALRLGPVVALLGILVLCSADWPFWRVHQDVGREPGARQRERRRPRYQVLHDGFHACWDLLIVWLHRFGRPRRARTPMPDGAGTKGRVTANWSFAFTSVRADDASTGPA